MVTLCITNQNVSIFHRRTLQPLFLLGLIAFYANDEGNITTAYLYAAGVILCSALNVIIMHPYMLGTMHTGMKVRVAMCSMIYRKALRLSKTALGNTTAGQVVNLISNDVGRLDLAMIFIHYLWVGPLETVLITYLMYREVSMYTCCEFVQQLCVLHSYVCLCFISDWRVCCIWCSVYAAFYSTSRLAGQKDVSATFAHSFTHR